MAVSSKHTGWRRNADGTLALYVAGTLVATFSTTGVTWATGYDQVGVGDLTAEGAVTLPQALTIGGIAYTFPADNGDSGEQLQTDGDGALSWAASGV